MMVGGRRPVDKYLGQEARQQQPHPALRAQIFQLSINIFPHCELLSTADAQRRGEGEQRNTTLKKRFTAVQQTFST